MYIYIYISIYIYSHIYTRNQVACSKNRNFQKLQLKKFFLTFSVCLPLRNVNKSMCGKYFASFYFVVSLLSKINDG